MKFPSIIKTPKHSRFHYEPRYYDPVKEEIKAKIEAARRQMNPKAGGGSYQSNISQAFGQRERKSNQTSVVQLLLAAVLLGSFVGWLIFGNDFFYAYLAIFPVYVFFRIKTTRKKTD